MRNEMNNKEMEVVLFNLVKECVDQAFQQRAVGQKQPATILVVQVGEVCSAFSWHGTNS